MTLVYDIMANVSLDVDGLNAAAHLLLQEFVEHCGKDEVDKREAVGQIKRVVRIFETRLVLLVL